MEPHFVHLFASSHLQGQEPHILYRVHVATGVPATMVGDALDFSSASDEFRAQSEFCDASGQRSAWGLLLAPFASDARKLVALQAAAMPGSCICIQDLADPWPEETYAATIEVLRHATQPHRRWMRDEFPTALELYDELATVAPPAYFVCHPLCVDPYDPWSPEKTISPDSAHSWSAFAMYRTQAELRHVVSSFGDRLGGYEWVLHQSEGEETSSEEEEEIAVAPTIITTQLASIGDAGGTGEWPASVPESEKQPAQEAHEEGEEDSISSGSKLARTEGAKELSKRMAVRGLGPLSQAAFLVCWADLRPCPARVVPGLGLQLMRLTRAHQLSHVIKRPPS